MTKKELLEAILAELKAIHALLEPPADLPTPAEDYEAMAATLKPGEHTEPRKGLMPVRFPDQRLFYYDKDDKAGQY